MVLLWLVDLRCGLLLVGSCLGLYFTFNVCWVDVFSGCFVFVYLSCFGFRFVVGVAYSILSVCCLYVWWLVTLRT